MYWPVPGTAVGPKCSVSIERVDFKCCGSILSLGV